jgi:hypothetical protein
METAKLPRFYKPQLLAGSSLLTFIYVLLFVAAQQPCLIAPYIGFFLETSKEYALCCPKGKRKSIATVFLPFVHVFLSTIFHLPVFRCVANTSKESSLEAKEKCSHAKKCRGRERGMSFKGATRERGRPRALTWN